MIVRITSLLVIILFFAVEIKAQTNDEQLFSYTTDEIHTDWASKTIADVERAPIEIDHTLLSRIKEGIIKSFQITTLDNEVYEVEVGRVMNYFNNDWSITGVIDEDWRNSFTLSVSDGTILSSINHTTTHTFFEIVFSKEEQFHSFIKVDPHKKDDLTCGVHDGFSVTSTTREKAKTSQQSIQDSTTIDVMIVYTPRAKSWADFQKGGIRNVVNQSMAIAQNAVDNSEISMEFRLVYSALVDYTESGSSGTDLRRLTTSPNFTRLGSEYIGYMEEVHEWRDIHKADLVAMFTYTADVGGVAWLLRNENGDSRFGFSVTRVTQAVGLTHAHEMGHNMGNAHSRNQTSNAADADGGLFTYSTGWRWTGEDGAGYTSVMTYPEDDTRVDIFSNPDVNVMGAPSGSYTEPFSPADNARSMHEIKQTISLYREHIGIPTVQTDSIFNVTAGKAEVSATLLDPGESSISSLGVCISIYPTPNVSDLCTQSHSNSSSSFTVALSGLKGNTTYYIRSYATNNGGTAYSNDSEFKTRNIDGNNSAVTASRNRVLATGEQESEIKVTVLSSNFEPVEDVLVEIEQEGGVSDVSTITNITNENGIARFVVTSQQENTITYTAIADDLELNTEIEIEYLFSEPETTLGNNFPNPFNNQTVIPIVIPEASRARIDIYDINGSRVQTIFDQQMNAGYYEIPFYADRLAAGVYLYRLTTDQDMKFEKMLLLK